ncbi:MAG: hypothetical protein ACR2FG_04495 [Marmoricola sp.]
MAVTVEQDDADVFLAMPEGVPEAAVLVLSGSSGRIEEGRSRLLAEHGAAALSIRWFGGAGQPTGICEVPLETFVEALDRLSSYADRLGVPESPMGPRPARLVTGGRSRRPESSPMTSRARVCAGSA